jgi:hypothetical protein
MARSEPILRYDPVKKLKQRRDRGITPTQRERFSVPASVI